MSPKSLTDAIVRECPVLNENDDIASAVRAVTDSGLPALPVVGEKGEVKGIFGEREFMIALFPGYLGELRTAGFVPGTLDDALEKRATCEAEPVSKYMSTDEVTVEPHSSDVQVAEDFLHHRVLIVPVVEEGKVVGVITRSDFFRGLAERLLDHHDLNGRAG